MKNKIVLGVPVDGWVNVSFYDFSFTASYVTNVPFEILNNAYISLKENIPFCVYFNLESNGEINLFSDYKTYLINENGSTVLYSFDIEKEEVIKVFVSSIKDNIRSWAMWEDFEDPSEDDIDKGVLKLESMILKVDELLNKKEE